MLHRLCDVESRCILVKPNYSCWSITVTGIKFLNSNDIDLESCQPKEESEGPELMCEPATLMHTAEMQRLFILRNESESSNKSMGVPTKHDP